MKFVFLDKYAEAERKWKKERQQVSLEIFLEYV